MSLPITPYPDLKGESKISDRIKRLEDRVLQNELRDGVGYSVRRLTRGVSLVIKQGAGGGGEGERSDTWA